MSLNLISINKSIGESYMENEALNEIETLTNEGIRAIYQSKSEEKGLLQEKWRKTLYFSRFLRIVALFAIVISIGIAWYKTEIVTSVWYLIVLNIVCAIAVVTLFLGTILLILKPVLYIIRRKSKKLNDEISLIENDLLFLENYLIDKNIPDLKPKLTQKDYETLNERTDFKTLVKKYKETVIALYDCERKYRSGAINASCAGEWGWVSAAVIVIIIAVALIILYMAFIILLVIAVISIAFFILTINNNNYYRHSRKHYREPEFDCKQESFWERIINTLFDFSMNIFCVLDGKLVYKKTLKSIEKERIGWYKRIMKFGNYDIDINGSIGETNEVL